MITITHTANNDNIPKLLKIGNGSLFSLIFAYAGNFGQCIAITI